MRNDLEHGTIPSPKVAYKDENGRVRAGEPMIGAALITAFTRQTLDRVCCFVEDVTVYCLKKRLPQGIDITEQPLAERMASAPLRFHLCVTPGGLPSWVLAAHGRTFDQT
jgi:hypothetical protein